MGEPAERTFWRRTVAGAGWALLVFAGVLLLVAGWFTYQAGSSASALGYAVLAAGVLGLHAAPVLVVLSLLCGLGWAWVAGGERSGRD